MKKNKTKYYVIGSIIFGIFFIIGMFLVILITIFQVVLGNGSNNGDGVITRQVVVSQQYYDTYRKVLRKHLSTTTKTDVKGYVTPSRTILFYSILMDHYCESKVKNKIPAFDIEPACKVFDSLYQVSFMAQRNYKTILSPKLSDLDSAYAGLIRQEDSLAVSKFNEAYEINLDEDFRMVSIDQACINLSGKLGTDYCSNENVRSYLDELLTNGQESNSSPTPLFIYPLDYGIGTVTSLFNVERNIKGDNGVSSTGVHSGWDIGAPSQSKIYSICDGTVTSLSNAMKENVGGGATNYLIIKCDATMKDEEIDKEYEIRYWHLYPDSIKVSVGQHVRQGQHIAGVGTTGNSTGNHLHLQMQFVNESNRRLDAFYFINWQQYFAPILGEKYDDVEYENPEEDDDESTSFDDELNEKNEENNENINENDQQNTTKPFQTTQPIGEFTKPIIK